jgi:hypothetical protein
MKNKKINFENFEIIKEGQNQIKGGLNGGGQTPPVMVIGPASKPTIPPTTLPTACDNLS